MNKVWRENFEAYLNEAEERGLEPFRSKDKTYEAQHVQRAGLRPVCREILERLTAEEREALTAYHACSEELLRLERHESYRQGYLDCVRMLRHLGLWEVFR